MCRRVAKNGILCLHGWKTNLIIYFLQEMNHSEKITRSRETLSVENMTPLELLAQAAMYGHVDTLKEYEKKHDLTPHLDTLCRIAVLNGNLSVLKYVVEQGANVFLLKHRTLQRCERHNYRDVIKYLRKKGVGRDMFVNY